MSYDPNKPASVVITVDGKQYRGKRTVQTVPVTKPSQAESEFKDQIESMKNDITCFVAEGRQIRAEVEGLIVWRRHMGEASLAPTTWGPTQQAHAAHQITYQRARLAKLKSAIEAKRPDVVEIINSIFSKEYQSQYPAEVTEQVREELGI
jgi:hypothetical protein